MHQREDIEGWVADVAGHGSAAEVVWCTGRLSDLRMLEAEAVKRGDLVAVDGEGGPRGLLARRRPELTDDDGFMFTCTDELEDAGTCTWMSRAGARHLWQRFAGAFRGRTLYVVPYLLGPLGSAAARGGVQLTDSALVVAQLFRLVRCGDEAMAAARRHGFSARCVHASNAHDDNKRFVCHFPATGEVWSYGFDSGPRALLATSAHALGQASVLGLREGWLATRMATIGVRTPTGARHVVGVVTPPGGGRTTAAMLTPDVPGYAFETIGDDVAWLHPGGDGRLWATNPIAGVHGLLRGVSSEMNPRALSSLRRNDAIFTNAAVADGTPWWPQRGGPREMKTVVDWRGTKREPGDRGVDVAHAQARFTLHLSGVEGVAQESDDPRGVPLSAIIFASKRRRLGPLVYETRSWSHGVYAGAMLASEGPSGDQLPVACPLGLGSACPSNIAPVLSSWLAIERRASRAPRVFCAQWAGDDAATGWLGFGDNARVIRWALARIDGSAGGVMTPLGVTPHPDDLRAPVRALHVDHAAWLRESQRCGEVLKRWSPCPLVLLREHQLLLQRLTGSS